MTKKLARILVNYMVAKAKEAFLSDSEERGSNSSMAAVCIELYKFLAS
jgi:hypothetical protein